MREGPLTVEFDFVDPIAGLHGIDELCFHRLQKVGHADRSD